MNLLIKILLPVLFFTKFSSWNSSPVVLCSDKCQSDSIKTGWYFVVDSNGYKVQLDKTDKLYQLHPIPFISKKDIEKVKVVLTKDKIYALEMEFNKKAAKIWQFATDKSFKENSELAFVLNGKLVYTAIAKHGKSSDGKAAIIREDYSKVEMEEMKSALQRK